MEFATREKSIQELRAWISKLTIALVAVSVALMFSVIGFALQSKIILIDVPGLPTGTEIQKSGLSMDGQRAVLMTVTDHLAQVNPANAEYQKRFVQAFLSPTAYTNISKQIDDQVQLLTAQHELGSYYFVFRSHAYDPALKKHFIIGDVHTVNAARDSSEPYVFEYDMHVDNYRPVVDAVVTYKGEKPHDSEYYKQQQGR